MKILFVNFHPVDSQVVRYAAKSLKNKGHSVKFLFSEKENIIEKIIKRDGFECIKIGSIKSGFLNRVITSIFFEINLLRKIKQFKPDILISPSSIYTGIAAKLFKIPFIAWADTETATVNLKSSLPYIDSILIPDVFYEKINNPKKVIKFKAYKEIAYLHLSISFLTLPLNELPPLLMNLSRNSRTYNRYSGIHGIGRCII